MMTDEQYMKIALQLAESARGNTNPNPLVGAVIVKGGVIVGTGLHRKAGEPHAEVHAFRMAGEHAKGATLYVTLEPCSHYGKTPPCAKLVKESEVARVVVAMEDPNPAVAGRGIRLLQQAGIEVEVGVLREEAYRLNERFIHNMLTEKPFVLSKFAMTLDGKIATYTGHSQWVSGETSRKEVHEIRHEVDGILVGVGTVLADNPSLTTRLVDREGRQSTRIVFDRRLRTPLDAKIMQTEEAPTIIVTTKNAPLKQKQAFEANGVHIIEVEETVDGLSIDEALRELYKKNITHILLEGGAQLNASFKNAHAIQKYIVYVAPKILGGKEGFVPFAGQNPSFMDEATQLVFEDVQKIGEDLKIIAYPKK